ncbi:MAG: hypothetical protein AAF771_06300 [Pseudomonadota bacterium]
MTGFAVIQWSAAFLWCYWLVLAAAWFHAVAREDTETHVAHFVSLMGVLVPVVALSVLMILIGATFGIPWVVVLLAITIPGGLVVALQLEVSRLSEPRLDVELVRLGLAALMTGLAGATVLL